MEESEIESKSVQIATRVIIHAGNARTLVHEALLEIEKEDFSAAEAKLSQAEKEIVSAHEVQTDVIQAEARGEKLTLTLLLTHAQDTLMVAMSEVQMTHHLIGLLRKYVKKS